MRISDWSSDVCSSDLRIAFSIFGREGGSPAQTAPSSSVKLEVSPPDYRQNCQHACFPSPNLLIPRSWKGPGLGEGRRIMNGDSSKPIGHQYALAMLGGGEEKVRSVALAAGSQLTMDAFLRVHDEEPVPAFLHSALCAMSLPTKRPKDDTLPKNGRASCRERVCQSV